MKICIFQVLKKLETLLKITIKWFRSWSPSTPTLIRPSYNKLVLNRYDKIVIKNSLSRICFFKQIWGIHSRFFCRVFFHNNLIYVEIFWVFSLTLFTSLEVLAKHTYFLLIWNFIKYPPYHFHLWIRCI